MVMIITKATHSKVWKTLSYALQAADSSIGGPVAIHLEAGEYEETL